MATKAETLSTNTLLKENPREPLEVTDPVSANPDRVEDSAITMPSDEQDSESSKGTEVSSISGNNAPVSDTEKKIRRAERFGITVQLSEQERRNSRAERFGTGSTLKNSEEQKKAARAERFGLPVNADEEAKKKARLERFAPPSKMDVLEQEKRKAREIRFSESASNSLSMNGKESIEPNAAIAGKAGGGS